ncbi:MAG: hypothetical protein C5B49_14570 [Bdellovibrio sp.]|nr:MAG: hypothetical protein C5B49_14570 [Bdellovibrio sp.]
MNVPGTSAKERVFGGKGMRARSVGGLTGGILTALCCQLLFSCSVRAEEFFDFSEFCTGAFARLYPQKLESILSPAYGSQPIKVTGVRENRFNWIHSMKREFPSSVIVWLAIGRQSETKCRMDLFKRERGTSDPEELYADWATKRMVHIICEPSANGKFPRKILSGTFEEVGFAAFYSEEYMNCRLEIMR